MTQFLDIKKLVHNIIHNNQYMTLATSNEDMTAWISPVVYAFDEQLNFYFISRLTSRHVQNLRRQPKLSFAIFDSHQDFGQGVGLQIEAVATELLLKEAKEATNLFLNRHWVYGSLNNPSWFTEALEGKEYVIYKLQPIKAGMNNPNPKDANEEDVRIEVDLQ